MNNYRELYYTLLLRTVMGVDVEQALSSAADLGKCFLKKGILPEDTIEMHQSAVLRLAQENPLLNFVEVAECLMAPLMEISMAYSMAFRLEHERKDALRGQQAHASRLESIGTMAAGIAHDFNTIMGIINGYAEMLQDTFTREQDGYEFTAQIIEAATRARDLIIRMMAFARQSSVEQVQVDAAVVIKKMLDMVAVTLPPDIVLHFRSELEIALVMAAPLQLDQIVMNLCINAADAMDGHGEITIGLTAASPLLLADGSALKRLCLTVNDDGCGISQEQQKRVFDPFFTTKAPGKGSGLGLSVVYGVVMDLHGEIEIQSEIGLGTRFYIYLPLSEPEQVLGFLE